MFSNLKPHFRQTLILAVPVMLSQLGHILVGVFDSLMLGRLGAIELAAASLSNSILSVGMVLGIGISYGSTPLVAAANGAGNKLRIGILLNNSLALCGLAGIGLSGLLIAASYFLPFMNQPEEVVRLAIPYFQITACSILPLMVFQGYRQFLEGLSYTKQAMVLSVGCNLLNIMLNYLLIYGKFGFPTLGMNGAAVATLIARILMAASMIIYVHRAAFIRPYRDLVHWSGMSGRHMGRMLQIGLPSGLQMMLEVGAFSFSAVMIGWLGALPLAAHQIAISLAALTYMMATGISAAATIRSGHFYGSRMLNQLRLAGFSAMWMVLLFMLVNGILFVVFRHQIPLLFIRDFSVVEIAADLLIVAAFFQLSDGLQVVALGALRGLEDVKIPTIITVLAYWVCALPIGYFCGFVLGWGAFGVWVGLGVGLSVAAILLVLRFRQITAKLHFG